MFIIIILINIAFYVTIVILFNKTCLYVIFSSYFRSTSLLCSYPETSKVIYSKVNLQINSEHLMFFPISINNGTGDLI